MALERDRLLACFGRSDLTFLATVAGATVDCVAFQIEPAWLGCPPVAYLAPPPAAETRPAPGAAAGDLSLASAGVRLLEAHGAPGSGIGPALFIVDTTVRVTGHFDDPAAAACRIVSAQPGLQTPSPAEAVLGCRAAFVVTLVQPESAG